LDFAVNNYLLEKHARELVRMDVCDALSSVLRPMKTQTRDSVARRLTPRMTPEQSVEHIVEYHREILVIRM